MDSTHLEVVVGSHFIFAIVAPNASRGAKGNVKEPATELRIGFVRTGFPYNFMIIEISGQMRKALDSEGTIEANGEAEASAEAV